MNLAHPNNELWRAWSAAIAKQRLRAVKPLKEVICLVCEKLF